MNPVRMVSPSHEMRLNEIRSQLRSIVALSESMLGAARQKEWGTVVDLLNRRQNLLCDYLAREIPPDLAGDVSRAAQEVLSINEQIAALGSLGRSVVDGAVRTLPR
jgi:hypothetical protein